MSWLTKISDMAGKAEDMLNRLDQTTGEVVSQAKNSSSIGKRSNSYATLKNQASQDVDIHTEEIGRSGPSLPSRTHSEYAAGQPTGRRKLNDSFAPSTSIVMEKERFDEFSLLNDDSASVTQEIESRSRRSSGGRSGVSTTASHHSVLSEQPDLKSQIWAKDTQISSMKTKLAELERRLEKRSQEFYELKAEKEMLEQRLAQNTSSDSIEELQLARKKVQEQKDMLMDECSQMKRKVTIMEDEVRAMADQLRLAKFNLSENKKEFDGYKEKAQKILQAKEKLIDSLKTEQGVSHGADRPGHLVLAELEEMKVERDLARADLEAAQLQLYNLRSDMEELENQLREEQIQQSELRRQHMDERCSWQSSVNLLNEKIECSRIENGFIKQEMKRQGDDLAKQLEEKEKQLRRSVEAQRSMKREEEYRNDPTAGEKLMQKQVELEDALRQNHTLTLRLERLQKSSRETVIPMEYAAPSLSVGRNPTAQKALTVLDTLTFKFISMLRNYPTARLVVAFYFVLIHLWVFFIICTYTPEIHDHDSFPASPTA